MKVGGRGLIQAFNGLISSSENPLATPATCQNSNKSEPAIYFGTMEKEWKTEVYLDTKMMHWHIKAAVIKIDPKTMFNLKCVPGDEHKEIYHPPLRSS